MKEIKTQRDFLEVIIRTVESQEIVDFAKDEIQKLDKRNAKRRSSQTAKQKENEAIKEKILESLSAKEITLASDVAKEQKISTQKASALLRQLAIDELVAQEDVKVKSRGVLKGYKLIE